MRAPELVGRGGWVGLVGRGLGDSGIWTGTAGDEAVTLAGLRGRVVLLDFWTAGCVNCLHVTRELAELERRFPDTLQVLGIHSPKFPYERTHDAVVAAVAQLDLHHPVLDDLDLATWSRYAVRAWPTLVLVDPQGYVVHVATGEGHLEELSQRIAEIVADGPVRRGPPLRTTSARPDSGLLHPGKLCLLDDGDLMVSDTGHHQLVRLRDGREIARYGTGEPALRDGANPAFAAPQGVLAHEGAVWVADAGNHAVRRLDLGSGEVSTVAGTGELWRKGDPTSGPALATPLKTPWDLTAHDGAVVIAMAGLHQLWELRAGRVEVLAGTRAEQLRDGPALQAYLAQPSGVASDGVTLWFVDAESSALRTLRGGEVTTVLGSDLFDWGDEDGTVARLQHPTGVAMLPDGAVAVCDTYNGAVRRYEPQTRRTSTLVTGLAEPTAAVLVNGLIHVVERARHRVSSWPLTDCGPGFCVPDVRTPADSAPDRQQGPS